MGRGDRKRLYASDYPALARFERIHESCFGDRFDEKMIGLCLEVSFVIERADSIPPGPGGKFQPTISLVQPEFGSGS